MTGRSPGLKVFVSIALVAMTFAGLVSCGGGPGMPRLPSQAAPDQAAPDQAAPDQAAPDQAAPDQAAPDQAAPDQAAPDLVVESPSVSNSDPAIGAMITLSATARNGGATASAGTTLRFYRSTDATITTTDTEVEIQPVAALSPSDSSAHSISLEAPATAGTYYYGACVDAVTDESDTTSNCSAAVEVNVSAAAPQMQAQPDLVVEFGVSDLAPAPGATFTLFATVSNDGEGASAATTVRYYQSQDATITTSDTEVGTGEVEALAASGSSSRKSSVDVTAPATAGTYYYGACVDAVTDESDATNNCSSSVEETVQVSDGLPVVRIYGVSGAVTEGTSARFGVTVTPTPTAALTVSLSYSEHALTEDSIILYYEPRDTTVTVNAGSSSATLTVDTIDDSDEDGNSWLSVWVNHAIGYTHEENHTSLVVVAIVDDDVPAGDPVLSITAVSASVSEGTAVEFTLTAIPPPATDVTVGYRMHETGSTLSATLLPGWTPGTLTISANQRTATLSFATVNDSTDEDDSEVFVTLRGVDTYPDGVIFGEPSYAYVTVLDDD